MLSAEADVKSGAEQGDGVECLGGAAHKLEARVAVLGEVTDMGEVT